MQDCVVKDSIKLIQYLFSKILELCFSLQENSLGLDGAIFIATALKGNHQLAYIK